MPYNKSQRVGTLEQWLENEFSRLERAFAEPEVEVRLKQLNAAPSRYVEGMIVYADGTNWNPGSGKGVYVYDGSSWVKL